MSGSDKAEHKAEEMKGRLKEGAGDALDDDDLRARGQGDQAKAQVKQAGDQVKDAAGSVKDRMTDKD